jgi:hypothetical protein
MLSLPKAKPASVLNLIVALLNTVAATPKSPLQY